MIEGVNETINSSINLTSLLPKGVKQVWVWKLTPLTAFLIGLIFITISITIGLWYRNYRKKHGRTLMKKLKELSGNE